MKHSLRVAFVFPVPRSQMYGMHQEALPSNAFYGSRELAQFGLDMVEIEPSVQTAPWARMLSRVERQIHRVTKVGITASMYLSKLDVLNEADVICAPSDRPATAIAFLRALGLVRRPLIWWTMRLYDTCQNELPRCGQMLVRSLMNQASRVVTLAGQSRRFAISEVFDIPVERIVSLHWGADAEYYSPNQGNERQYVFTAGRACRDFPLLFDAVRQIDVVLRMVAPVGVLVGYDIPQNVLLIPGATLVEGRRLLDAARLVVVATLPNHFCAGQWTVFSAMSMGKPVIWTEHQAAKDYDFKHRLNISLVERRSPDLLREIQWHLDHPGESAEIGRNARRLVVESWNMRNYARELLPVLNAVAESDVEGR